VDVGDDGVGAPNVTSHPNPSPGEITIEFSLVRAGLVRLAIYDLRGRLVRRVATQEMAAGPYRLRWDGKDDAGAPVASGVYFWRLSAPDVAKSERVVLVR
jgi:flagellar hook assembly protein FlgD